MCCKMLDIKFIINRFDVRLDQKWIIYEFDILQCFITYGVYSREPCAEVFFLRLNFNISTCSVFFFNCATQV